MVGGESAVGGDSYYVGLTDDFDVSLDEDVVDAGWGIDVCDVEVVVGAVGTDWGLFADGAAVLELR